MSEFFSPQSHAFSCISSSLIKSDAYIFFSRMPSELTRAKKKRPILVAEVQNRCWRGTSCWHGSGDAQVMDKRSERQNKNRWQICFSDEWVNRVGPTFGPFPPRLWMPSHRGSRLWPHSTPIHFDKPPDIQHASYTGNVPIPFLLNFLCILLCLVLFM